KPPPRVPVLRSPSRPPRASPSESSARESSVPLATTDEESPRAGHPWVFWRDDSRLRPVGPTWRLIPNRRFLAVEPQGQALGAAASLEEFVQLHEDALVAPGRQP